MYNNELIRLVGLADPDVHAKFAKSFDFYKKESEDHPDFYEKQLGIERKVVEEGGFIVESTYYRGLLHSYMDKPAKITTKRTDPTFKKEEWYYSGKLHRQEGPAVINVNKNLKAENWYYDGVRHRIGGPAVISESHDNNQFLGKVEQWHYNGKLHREEGPANITMMPMYTNQEWYYDGKRHRTDGPAVLTTDNDDGEIYEEEWYVDDIKFDPKTKKPIGRNDEKAIETVRFYTME